MQWRGGGGEVLSPAFLSPQSSALSPFCDPPADHLARAIEQRLDDVRRHNRHAQVAVDHEVAVAQIDRFLIAAQNRRVPVRPPPIQRRVHRRRGDRLARLAPTFHVGGDPQHPRRHLRSERLEQQPADLQAARLRPPRPIPVAVVRRREIPRRRVAVDLPQPNAPAPADQLADLLPQIHRPAFTLLTCHPFL